MKVLDTGNHLVALAVRAAGVEVVPAYPITPQTQVVEKIADLIDHGEMDAEYIPVESEHSACAALIAASLTGVRAFSATSAHGLAYMHEMLHFAAGLRTPVVMANVNRSLGPGWNIWCDHQDSISARDTGWLQVYVSSHQETVDTVIQAFKIVENHDVLLPIMVNLDAFVISHTYMDALVPEREEVSRFLPDYRPLWALDTRLPVTHGSVVYPSEFSETRQSIEQSQMKSRKLIKDTALEFKEQFGRWHGDMVDSYMLEDADYVIVTMGSLAAESRISIDDLRGRGLKAGLLRVRFFRPFPADELQELCGGRKSILVVDRNFSYGNAGVLYTELKSAIYGLYDTPVKNLIVGLGGRDVSHSLISEKAEEAFRGELGEITWGDTHVTEAHEVTRGLLDQFRELYGE